MTFPDVLIRSWAGADEPAIRELLRAYLADTGAGDPSDENTRRIWERGMAAVETHPVLVAVVEDDAGGRIPCCLYLCAPPVWGLEQAVSTAEVVVAYTLPAFRGRGIREAVRELALRWLRRAGVGLVVGAARYTDQGAIDDLRKHGARPLMVSWGREP